MSEDLKQARVLVAREGIKAQRAGDRRRYRDMVYIVGLLCEALGEPVQAREPSRVQKAMVAARVEQDRG